MGSAYIPRLPLFLFTFLGIEVYQNLSYNFVQAEFRCIVLSHCLSPTCIFIEACKSFSGAERINNVFLEL